MKQLPAGADIADVLRAIELDGGVVIRDLAPVGVMEEAESELESYFADTPTCEGYFVGWRTQRMGGLIAKSRACRQLITEPLVLGIMDRLLGPHCSSYQLNLTQAIRILPGEVEQAFHRDDELFPCPPVPGMELMVNALWAGSDFTVRNGATRIVRGSHKETLEREPDASLIEYAEMPRGSVLIYLGSTVHSGGANNSSAPRTALTMSYNLGWLRQAENQYLAVPPALARTLPEPLQRLIGYAIHAPNLGWYEGQDPSIVLQTENAPATLAAKDYLPEEVVAMLRERHDQLTQSRLTVAS